MELGVTTSGARRGDGFTLIELMVVIAIAAIAAAMILPEMRGTFEEALLRSTARKLTDACNAASSRAITRNQTQTLRLDTRTGRYVIEPKDGTESSSSASNASNQPGAAASGSEARVEGQWDARISIEFGGPAAEGADASDAASPPPTAESKEDRDVPEGSREMFTFHPDGTASGPSLVLRDRDGFRLGFAVHSITGRVRLTELPRK